MYYYTYIFWKKKTRLLLIVFGLRHELIWPSLSFFLFDTSGRLVRVIGEGELEYSNGYPSSTLDRTGSNHSKQTEKG